MFEVEMKLSGVKIHIRVEDEAPKAVFISLADREDWAFSPTEALLIASTLIAAYKEAGEES